MMELLAFLVLKNDGFSAMGMMRKIDQSDN